MRLPNRPKARRTHHSILNTALRRASAATEHQVIGGQEGGAVHGKRRERMGRMAHTHGWSLARLQAALEYDRHWKEMDSMNAPPLVSRPRVSVRTDRSAIG